MSRRQRVGPGLVEVVLAALMVAAIPGCAELRDLGPKTGTHYGPSRAMGGGRAQAFVTLNAGGEPTAIGVRVSEAALSGLPAEPPPDADGWEYVLALPGEAASSGYDHVGIDWNPKGHIPPGVYDTPHFDFHFYLISLEQRERITARGEDLARAHRAPAPEFMPEGYILPDGTEVPRMGAHAIDPTAPEFNRLSFTRTFIYGFYDGSMVFLEPMVTRAFLGTKPNVTAPVKAPQAYSHHAYYPTHYRIAFDEARREYTISLEDLVPR